ADAAMVFACARPHVHSSTGVGEQTKELVMSISKTRAMRPALLAASALAFVSVGAAAPRAHAENYVRGTETTTTVPATSGLDAAVRKIEDSSAGRILEIRQTSDVPDNFVAAVATRDGIARMQLDASNTLRQLPADQMPTWAERYVGSARVRDVHRTRFDMSD